MDRDCESIVLDYVRQLHLSEHKQKIWKGLCGLYFICTAFDSIADMRREVPPSRFIFHLCEAYEKQILLRGKGAELRSPSCPLSQRILITPQIRVVW